MKEIFFVMSMWAQGQNLPPTIEPMGSLEACQARVAETTKLFVDPSPDMNTDYRFAAGCMIKSTKANPA